MNPVSSYNVQIIIFGILMLLLLILLIWKLNMPWPFKILVIGLIIALVPYFRLFISTLGVYSMLLNGNKTMVSTYAKKMFRENWITRHNLHELSGTKGVIFASNYPCPFYNYLVVELLPENTYLIGMGNRYWGVGLFAKNYYPLNNSGNFDKLQKFINHTINKGFNVLVFVEEIHTKEKRDIWTIGRIKSGIFNIAYNLNIPVIPIFIAPMPFVIGWPIRKDHHIIAGSRMKIKNPQKSRDKIKGFFQKCMNEIN